MIDNKEISFAEAANPLIKWLNEYGNPHSMIIVDADRAELFSGEMCFNTDEFVKD